MTLARSLATVLAISTALAGALAGAPRARAGGSPVAPQLHPEDAKDEGPLPPPGPDGIVRLPSLRIDLNKKDVEVDGRINMRNGLVEVFACTEHGKKHESVMVWLCKPRYVRAGLMLLGMKEKPEVENFGDGGALTGERVAIDVSWDDPEAGRRVEYRAEELVLDKQRGEAMERCGFAFTGSRFQQIGVDKSGKPHEIFMADASGQIATTYHDPDAILDNPLTKGGDDTIYFANSKVLPRAGTPCLVRLRPMPRDVTATATTEAPSALPK
jgi:hypothetical protein